MFANSNYFFWVLIFCLLIAKNSGAQSKIPLLERKISIQLNNEPIDLVLQKISSEIGFSFSYTPQVINDYSATSIKAVNKSVREVLNSLFDGKVNYKEKGNHIILVRSETKKQEQKRSSFIITGYIKSEDGSEISEASIFDKKSRASTITNKYGFFNLKIDKHLDQQIILSVNKAQYKDTIVYVRQTGNSIINITLFPEELKVEPIDSLAIMDSLLHADQMAFINFLISQEAKVNTKNIKDTLHQKYQVSLIPYIGTNARLSGNTINDYSLNIFGGYSMGTRKVELGGFFNVNRDTVRYLQMAGLFNFNGGYVEGVQASGLINANMDPVNGVELAGLVNFNSDTVEGVQLAGLLNVNLKPISGVQGAGLLNVLYAKESSVAQVAGLMNASLGNASGIQVSGLLNICAKEFEGVQATGLVNYATRINGSQIGILNISDTCSGIPIGFLSYVNKGYHQLEISTDELYPINISIRTGVRSFYNILSAGMLLDSLEDIQWYFGYGIGTALNIGKKWQLNLDVNMNQPLHGNILNSFAPLSKLNVTVEKRFSKYFSIAAGPCLNYLVYNDSDDYLQSLASEIPSTLKSTSRFSNNYLSKTWLGGKIALRFF